MAGSSSDEIAGASAADCRNVASPAVRVPHEGRIFVDALAEDYLLTDTLTYTRVKLPRAMSLVFAEGVGNSMLVSDKAGVEDTMKTDAMLGHDVWVDSNGVLIFVPHGRLNEKRRLDEMLAFHKAETAKIPFVLTAGHLEIRTYVFEVATTADTRIYWSLPDVYKIVKLTTYKGKPSVWISAGIPSWNKNMQKYFPGDRHVRFSKHGNSRSEKIKSLSWDGRCLPEPSIGTLAFLNCLNIWSCQNEAGGGLRGNAARAAASSILESFVNMVSSDPLTYPLAVWASCVWQCRSPRPSTGGTSVCFYIPLLPNGTVDLRPLFVEVDDTDAAALHTQQRWVNALADIGIMEEAATPGLLNFFRSTIDSYPLATLRVQLLWGVAKQVERWLQWTGIIL